MVQILLAIYILLLSQFQCIRGGQTALRVRSKQQLQARSLDLSAFEPTDSEIFHTVGGKLTPFLNDRITPDFLDDPNFLYTSYHEHAERRFVNFEKFEHHLQPGQEICSSLDNKTTILNFPFDPQAFYAARRAWKGVENLVFIGHDDSCFAPQGDRSSFK